MTPRLIVYVLFRETNTGHSDESDGYIQAIYQTNALAEAARLTEIRKARDAGESVWFDPDKPDDEGPDDWTHDWHVEAHEVLDAVGPNLPIDELCPTCGSIPGCYCSNKAHRPNFFHAARRRKAESRT